MPDVFLLHTIYLLNMSNGHVVMRGSQSSIALQPDAKTNESSKWLDSIHKYNSPLFCTKQKIRSTTNTVGNYFYLFILFFFFLLGCFSLKKFFALNFLIKKVSETVQMV